MPGSARRANATAIAPIRTRAIALSLMFTRSAPLGLDEARRLDRPLEAHRARRVDLDADDEAPGGEGRASRARRRRAVGRAGVEASALAAAGTAEAESATLAAASAGARRATSCVPRSRARLAIERLAHRRDVLGRGPAAAPDEARAAS